MQEDDLGNVDALNELSGLAYYDALEDLGDAYESYQESEEDAEDPEQVTPEQVGELLSVTRLHPVCQLGGKRSSAGGCAPFLAG